MVLAIASIASAQSQTIRNSTPPNPLNPVAYLLDPAGAPVVGDTWSPTVDDSLFSPPPAAGATWFVGITTGPASPEMVFSGGTILVNLGGPNPLAQLGPIAATGGAISFDTAVPPMPSIVGSSFSTQAFLDDPGSGFRVTNAIDILVGVGPHGLYTVSANEDVLRTITMAGALVTTTTLTLPGESVLGVNGLAKDSSTGRLYAIVKVSGSPAPPAASGHNKRKKSGTAALGAVGRRLVEVDPATGVCSLVGDTGESFAGITFDGTGTLWGVTGDGSLTPESLFTISTEDGSAT
ncbi:MAG: hypothetical protein O7B99_13220, partial [Planctomycetota bacterium]|nr:hypothetical protein [Planctomycetota bacterium]